MGTQNVKKDTAVTHNRSQTHTIAQEALKPKEDVPIVKAIHKMNESTRGRQMKLFDIAYTVAHREMSFKRFQIMCDLEKKHGVDLGERYQSDMACQEFIGAIDDVMFHELMEKVKQPEFYCSIVFDGSTDKTLTEREVISVKFLDEGVAKMYSIKYYARRPF